MRLCFLLSEFPNIREFGNKEIVRQRRLIKAFAAIKFSKNMDDAIMFSESFSVRLIFDT
jgi:hypothetical protein